MGKFVSRIATATMTAAAVACASMSAHAMPIPTMQEIGAAGAPGNVRNGGMGRRCREQMRTTAEGREGPSKPARSV